MIKLDKKDKITLRDVWYSDTALNLKNLVSGEPQKIKFSSSNRLRILFLLWSLENDNFSYNHDKDAILKYKKQVIFDIDCSKNKLKLIDNKDLSKLIFSYISYYKNEKKIIPLPKGYEWEIVDNTNIE